MPKNIVDDPAPLTPQTAYPFAVTAFPVRDLVASGAHPGGGGECDRAAHSLAIEPRSAALGALR
jgi:hypothetical protein